MGIIDDWMGDGIERDENKLGKDLFYCREGKIISSGNVNYKEYIIDGEYNYSVNFNYRLSKNIEIGDKQYFCFIRANIEKYSSFLELDLKTGEYRWLKDSPTSHVSSINFPQAMNINGDLYITLCKNSTSNAADQEVYFYRYNFSNDGWDNIAVITVKYFLGNFSDEKNVYFVTGGENKSHLTSIYVYKYNFDNNSLEDIEWASDHITINVSNPNSSFSLENSRNLTYKYTQNGTVCISGLIYRYSVYNSSSSNYDYYNTTPLIFFNYSSQKIFVNTMISNSKNYTSYPPTPYADYNNNCFYTSCYYWNSNGNQDNRVYFIDTKNGENFWNYNFSVLGNFSQTLTSDNVQNKLNISNYNYFLFYSDKNSNNKYENFRVRIYIYELYPSFLFIGSDRTYNKMYLKKGMKVMGMPASLYATKDKVYNLNANLIPTSPIPFIVPEDGYYFMYDNYSIQIYE